MFYIYVVMSFLPYWVPLVAKTKFVKQKKIDLFCLLWMNNIIQYFDKNYYVQQNRMRYHSICRYIKYN